MMVLPGRPFPLGAQVEDGGVHFAIYSKLAWRLELLLYDHADAPGPSEVIALDADRHRTNHYWHAFVSGIGAGQLYAYRAHGPWAPEQGQRFDAEKVLLDPYARAVSFPSAYDRAAACRPGPNDAQALRGVVSDDGRAYDWEGDLPLRRPFSQTVIYELHVRGFTQHPSSRVAEARRGTFAGLIDKIPYLQELGVTAVELLPIFAFDPQDAPAGRVNYWGYSPVSFFAPHPAYGSTSDSLGVLDELRDAIKALHRGGIEVILDVVYNHTTEGDGRGPTQSLRGLANGTYYTLDDQGGFANYAGTGNTLNANRSVVRRLILDSLRYWVRDMHVDGFRFDLAAILSRDARGQPLPEPPLLWDIDTDPALAGTKLIAEAWDAAGLYQVGSFVGDFWKEWNGKFRDDLRAFVRGDPGMVPHVADRLLGSPDLYGAHPRQPEQSINFVTAHDGFTLNDLVCYDRKHNAANGENNRDGENHNLSWNHGVEGPSDDPEIESLRNRQIKNLLAVTLLSLGAPMLRMGDEMRQSQRGNNNAYCQDNEISWLDWRNLERHGDVHRFVRELIHLRSQRDHVRGGGAMTLSALREQARVRLHGIEAGEPDLRHESRSLALSASSLSGHLHMYFALNAWWQPLRFALPASPSKRAWRRVVDTSLRAPSEIARLENAPRVLGSHYEVGPRSVVALMTS